MMLRTTELAVFSRAARRCVIACASVALLTCALPACGGGQIAGLDAFRMARAQTADMGSDEDTAERFVREMLDALITEGTPEEKVARVASYVSENAEEMHEVAADIAEKFATLPETERSAYNEVMADRFAEPTFAWRDAYFGFIEEHPEHAAALEAAVAPAGPQLAPH